MRCSMESHPPPDIGGSADLLRLLKYALRLIMQRYESSAMKRVQHHFLGRHWIWESSHHLSAWVPPEELSETHGTKKSAFNLSFNKN